MILFGIRHRNDRYRFPKRKNANYARMIETGHDTLICVYEAGGNIEATVSHDAGNSWQTPVTIVAKTDGVSMSVPDILELNDHSLLVSYNPRPHKINGSWDTTKHFAIYTIKSYDGGATWKDKRLLYEAGATFENGCWEPSAVQLPSGEIQLFFSNEGIYTQSNEQNISLLRSTDNGVTWSHYTRNCFVYTSPSRWHACTHRFTARAAGSFFY